MIRTIDFNGFAAGTVIDDEYLASDGVTISATGGSAQAMIFDSNNPTGGDRDLASDTLGGLLIISEDGDSDDPDDNAGGGTITFDFENEARVKFLTFKDIEESRDGQETRIVFYDEDGNVISSQFVAPTGDGGEVTISLDVLNVSRMEVIFPGSGALDNLVFDDNLPDDLSPTAVDDTAETDEDSAIIIDLLGNDTDPDNTRYELTLSDFVSPNGTVVDNGDGTVTFTPDADFNGETTFTYTVTDPDGNSDTGEVTIDVAPVNDAPVAVDGTDTTDEDTSVTVDLLANDTDVDGDRLSVTTASVPAAQGSLVDNGDGTVTFTPAPDFNGEATISYTVSDGNGGTDSATHVITVAAVNDAPVAVDDVIVTDEDTASDPINVLDNDSDPDGDPLTLVGATSPDGTVEFTPEGEVIFTPNPDFNGETTIEYIVTDADGTETIGTITVTVTPVNDAPEAVDGADTTEEDTAITVDLLANDFDVDGDAISVVTASVPAAQGTLVDNGDGTVTFTPAADFVGEAEISYTIEDAEGLQDSAVHTVTVTEVDDAPTAVDDTATTDEDTPVEIDVLANDIDPDSELTILEATVPADQGSVEIVDDELVFTPAPDFNGEATITYTVTDPEGNTATANAVVTVAPVNDAPDAVDDADTTAFNTAVTVDLLANDSDVDGDAISVTVASVPAAEGSLVDNGDGTVTFTPVVGFTGTATITYTIADEEGLTDTAAHVITVEAPVLDGIVEGTDAGELIDETYDGDPEGDRVDNNDAILPGAAPNDDVILAGGGDDTVVAGEGDDSVEGGTGDDSILGGTGNDTVLGGAGNDTITTGNGDLAPDLGYPTADSDDLGYAADSDPENDRDSVDGGAGDDVISTGDDRDTITGGIGADSINAGIDDDLVDGGADDDRIVGGEGNDTIIAGDGNDTIFAGNDPDRVPDVVNIPDEETDGFIFSPDRNPDNGRDSVDGGAGDDLIFGADDDDTLIGGSGNDTIDGEIDDDQIFGGLGEDSLIGGQGNDNIAGGEGDDILDGGDGDDTLRGDTGNDTVLGGAGDDLLVGANGDDLLEGGAGDDDLSGGLGDDILRGGEGDDTLSGNGGEDLFTDVGAGDDIDGGDGPIDNDTLDLRGSAPEGGSLQVVLSDDDPEDGVVNFFDQDGNDAGQLVFEDIENIIPCFTPGTKIATPQGERLVEDLEVGDRVITRDNGIQTIRWVGAQDMTGPELEQRQHLKPVLIRAGALGNALPERDMMVSPNHRMLVANDKTALYFEEREVLVAAKHLTALDGVDIVDVSQTTYIHIMFDRHEVILSDGTWSESFQPGDMSLAGIGDAQRQEILELFPELATQDGVNGYTAARRSLKKFEAKLIIN